MNTDSLPEWQLQLEQLMPLIQERLSAGHKVRFMPRGVSMLPMLREGIDSVVLSAAPKQLKKFDLPLYQRADGKFVLHRIVAVGDSYSCIGDNQFALETGISHEQIIGLVTAFYRGEKEISVSRMDYRIYCLVWHYSRTLRRFYRRGKGKLGRALRRTK